MKWICEVTLSFVISFILLHLFIQWQKKKNIGQHIRAEGPNMHNYKEGTPTMGGIVFVSVFMVISLLFDRSCYNVAIVLSTFAFFVIGYLDGVIKILKVRSEGLKSYQKLALQFIAATIIYMFSQKLNPHTFSFVPFLGKWQLGWFYPIFAIIFLVGMSNSSNITDGLDGLAGGIYTIGAVGLVIFSIFEKLPLTTTIASLGAVLAFLFFNVKPAKVFMGDVGSLALGGYIGTIGILYGYEFWIMLLFPVFVIELVCDTVQIVSLRYFKKKVFRMAPIHHHYELKGQSEIKVTLSFWLLDLTIMIGSVTALCVFH